VIGLHEKLTTELDAVLATLSAPSKEKPASFLSQGHRAREREFKL